MMDRVQRAHIFNSFDSLRGFRSLLKEKERVVVPQRILSEEDLEELDRKIHRIHQGMRVDIVYYDQSEYVNRKGLVTKLDLDQKYIQIVKTRIDLCKIVQIYCDEDDE